MTRLTHCGIPQAMTLVAVTSAAAAMPVPVFAADDAALAPLPAKAGSFRLEQTGTVEIEPPKARIVDQNKYNSPYLPGSDRFAKLRRTNDLLELSYQALNLIDLAETLDCRHSHRCNEANPLIGRHPSTGTLVGFKAGMAVAHYLLHRLIRNSPKSDFAFEIASNVAQGAAVGLNFRYAFK